jgi:hypothetical protein
MTPNVLKDRVLWGDSMWKGIGCGRESVLEIRCRVWRGAAILGTSLKLWLPISVLRYIWYTVVLSEDAWQRSERSGTCWTGWWHDVGRLVSHFGGLQFLVLPYHFVNPPATKHFNTQYCVCLSCSWPSVINKLDGKAVYPNAIINY